MFASALRLVSTGLRTVGEACKNHVRVTFAPLKPYERQLRTLGMTAVSCFCLWHMSAVALYALPQNQEEWFMRRAHMLVTALGHCKQASTGTDFPDSLFMTVGLCSQPLSETYVPTLWVTSHLQKKVRPYVMATGMWQRWNLFSPDPLRRVSTFHLEAQDENGEWFLLRKYDPRAERGLRRAMLLKSIGRMEENNNVAVMLHLLTRFCDERGLADDVPVRFRRTYYVIPQVPTLTTPTFWQAFKPEESEDILASGTCRPPAQP